MDCILCKKPIEGYNIKFNQLKIDEFHSVAICSDCIDKFLKWQQTMFAVLFPTKSAKKWSIKK
ncbi:MAG: hypothetical protein APG08_00983 [Candidatus Methanofastidiosum methylothiophilum]|jgi:hypothetical protein|uniref:ClpX-type ZB domain-containing protein n=1 Tax=Candidatus Methanofastidiosum methylothiophilum TaxID=1705564 RepID=A0A150JGN6_9EURY|nr:MAG: hypothetical protein AN188_01002 [Candidatus Methanofastidiosum methylthiophilus]KYC56351.1 MAG: hypothetical protein APG08_00983 [Candidatus Methanofastidiosum methylthiophilus]KYC57267.1 MAG: hypothetical protein APG09_01083 [Candidatus Methanofastidiosum methylthiophilus]OQC49159.1 MAG: hypothetical protein BWX56_01564 [Euryarchaeota archaeon ADurb.Bin023]